MEVGQLWVKLGLDKSNFETGIKKSNEEIDSTNENIKKQDSLWSKLSGSAGSSNSGILSHVLNLKNVLVGLTATIGGGAGLFALVDGAVKAGDSTYRLSQKLHVTTTEAASMNRIFNLTNTDTQPFISTITRLDKGIESAGAKGNATTKSLAEFGVKLTDAHGKLLPIPAQLEALANAYTKSSDAGQDEAFTADVLGTKGQQLIPLLTQYTEAKEASSKVKGIGIDPKMAHETEVALTGLKMQVGQLGLVFANALMPVANTIIPPLMTGFGQMATFIKSNSGEISKGIGSFGSILKSIVTSTLPIVKDGLTFVATHGTLVKTAIVGITSALVAYKAITLAVTAAQEIHNALLLVSAIRSGGLAAAKTALVGVDGSATAAQWLLNAAEAAGLLPIIAIGVAIGALVGIVIYLWNTNKGFRDAVIGAWNAIKDSAVSVFNGIKNFFIGIWDWLKSFFAQWGTAILVVVAPFIGIPLLIYQHWGQIKEGLSAIWNGIKSVASAAWNGIINVIMIIISPVVKGVTNIFNSMRTGLGTIFNGIKEYFTGIWNVIKLIFLGPILLICDLVTGNFTKLKEDAVKIFTGLQNAFRQIWDGINQIFTGVIQSIAGFFEMEWRGMVNIATTIWNGLKNFFIGLWDGIKNTAVSAWNGIKKFFSDFWDAEVSGWTNILNGIKDFFINTWNKLVDFVLKLPGKFSSGVENIGTSIKNGFNSAIEFITGLPGKALQWGKDFIQGLIDGITGMIGKIGSTVSSVADKIRGILHFSTPDEGPLKDYETWMPDFMGGLKKGIDSNKSSLIDSVKNLASGMALNVKGSFSGNALAGVAQGNQSTINFNGNYGFNNRADIDYFMHQAAIKIQRRK